MQLGEIKFYTRVLATDQPQFIPVKIRDEQITVGEWPFSFTTNVMKCILYPTPEELALLNAGAPIVLSVLGTVYPGTSVEVDPNEKN